MKSEASMRFRIIVFIITAAFIAFAFIHSSMPSDVSDEESGVMFDFLKNVLSFLGLGDVLTNHIVRKLAHFTEFTAIGVTLTLCAYSFDRIRPHRYFSQVLFSGLLTAVIDETIQLGVEGRSGQITDVLIDFSGVITGFAAMLLILALYRRIKKIG